jgi:hypothetical protein
MTGKAALVLGLGLFVLAGAAFAAEPSPYAGWQERPLKAKMRVKTPLGDATFQAPSVMRP